MISSLKRAIKRCFKNNAQEYPVEQKVVDSFPEDFSEEEKKLIKRVDEYTMTSNERLVTLARAIDYIEEYKISGDIVECGVWRGGSMMLTALKLISLQNTDRNLYLFDTFEGMTEPTDLDKRSLDNKDAKQSLAEEEKMPGNNIWCIASLDEVKHTLRQTNYPSDKVHFVQGKVEDTLPYYGIEKISILRLDTDWYESTKHELETLFDKLVPGGVLIIDDYGHWSGAKKAVDEYIKQNNIRIFLNRIDYTGRLGIKGN